MTSVPPIGGTKAVIALVVLALPLAIAQPVVADSYEDQCVIAASRLLPEHAQISTTNTSPAPPAVVSQYHRDPGLRWVEVNFAMAVGNREIVRRYLCAKNINGQFYAFPPDNDPLQSTFDWAREHNMR